MLIGYTYIIYDTYEFYDVFGARRKSMTDWLKTFILLITVQLLTRTDIIHYSSPHIIEFITLY